MSGLNKDSRRIELLVDRATVGLTASEKNELERLLQEKGIADDQSFDATVALLQESVVESEMSSLPDSVRDKIVHDAHAFVELAQDESNNEAAIPREVKKKKNKDARGLGRREVLAWLAAAASLMIAAFLWFVNEESNARPLIAQSSASELSSFISSARPGELFQVELEAGPHTSGKGASGTVYWNRKKKCGFVSLSGVAANDPSAVQYQLWVIDRVRGIEDRPNAGVFSVSSSGSGIFEFRSDLKVFDAQGFAVTVEKPGGVNKSDLSKITLLNLGVD